MSEMNEFNLEAYITPEMSPENRIAVYAERIAYELQKLKPERRLTAAETIALRAMGWKVSARHLMNAGVWEEINSKKEEER